MRPEENVRLCLKKRLRMMKEVKCAAKGVREKNTQKEQNRGKDRVWKEQQQRYDEKTGGENVEKRHINGRRSENGRAIIGGW